MTENVNTPYLLAQKAMAELKGAAFLQLEQSGEKGMSNAELGRALGIYAGHVGHEGHISRTILGLMESEGVVIQDTSDKRWRLANS